MRIVGGGLAQVDRLVAQHRPGRVISLLSPGETFPAFPDRPHLRLEVHDIAEPAWGLRLADTALMTRLIDFVSTPSVATSLLVHCALGVSRSPAAALVVACALRPDLDDHDLACRLRAASPTCTPNRRLVDLGDRALGRDGRLLAAVDALGRGADYTGPARFDLHL